MRSVRSGPGGTGLPAIIFAISLSKVAAPRAHLVALVLWNFNADPVVTAVENVVRRDVGNGILIAKFVANILERLIQIIHVIRKERAATGFFGKILQNFVAVSQMIFAGARRAAIFVSESFSSRFC